MAPAPPDIPSRCSAWEKLAVFAAMLLISVAATWPLAAGLDTYLNDWGDPLLNAWILSWDTHALVTPGLSLFNAPIFHPEPLTLAYSEHMIVNAIMAWPVLWLGYNALVAHNVLFLLTFALSGLGGYLLGYQLTGRRAAAWLVGLGFAFSAFRFGHLGHLQILSCQFMPFVLLYLHRWQRAPRWGWALGFGFFWLLQILSCGYHALFISLAVGLFLIYYGLPGRWWRQRARLLQLGAVCLGILLLVAPFFYPYLQVKRQQGFVRKAQEVEFYSARPLNYLATPPASRLLGRLTAPFRSPEGQLYLGATLSLLVLLGLFVPRRRREEDEEGPGWSRQDQFFYLLLALVAFWASLGPRYGLYEWLYKLVPGFDALRVPARLAVLVSLSWAVLAGFGAARLQALLPARRWLAPLVVLVLGGMVLAEVWCAPYRWNTITPHPARVYRWLANQPGPVVVMELPTLGYKNDLARDARYLYWSTFHGKTLVNGYSGFFSPQYKELARLAPRLPDPAVLKLLRRRGTQYVILHLKEYPGARANELLERFRQSPELKPVFHDRWEWVFRILPEKG